MDKASAQQSEMAAKVVIDTSNIDDDLYTEPAPKEKYQPSQEEKKGASKMGAEMYGDFEVEDVGDGDQRMAVLPFKGQVAASWPTGYKNNAKSGEKPQGNLTLKYAHGFRSFDTRNNLKYINQNEVLFTTAALGVVLNKQANTQSFFNMHEEDVVALAIHPGRQIVATGQMAAKGKAKMIDIFVWDVQTKEVLARLNNFHRGAIRRLEFSPAGDKLLTIGEDE